MNKMAKMMNNPLMNLYYRLLADCLPTDRLSARLTMQLMRISISIYNLISESLVHLLRLADTIDGDDDGDEIGA
jgi:hypothetical protein